MHRLFLIMSLGLITPPESFPCWIKRRVKVLLWHMQTILSALSEELAVFHMYSCAHSLMQHVIMLSPSTRHSAWKQFPSSLDHDILTRILGTISASAFPRAEQAENVWVCFCCSVAKSCPTLCDPMGCNMPGFSVLLCAHSLLKFMRIESVMHAKRLV